MASSTGNIVYAYHSTLVASTVDTVTLQGNSPAVRVYLRGAGADTYVTVGSNAPAPTVGGNDCYVIPANSTNGVLIPNRGVDSSVSDRTVVQLISSGTPSYSVVGADVVLGVVI